jgi:hypothetical protein
MVKKEGRKVRRLVKKRGISRVVVVVLLVLLVLVSVMIIWGSVRPFISESSEKTTAKSDLIKVKLSLDGESIGVDEGNQRVCFSLERGSDDVDLTGFGVVLEDADGKTGSFTVVGGVGELEARKVGYDYSGLALNGIERVSIFPVMFVDGGETSGGFVDSVDRSSSDFDAVCGAGFLCGNWIVEGSEVCDSNSKSCTATGGYDGEEDCLSDCSDFGVCFSGESCGDGVINGNEVCEGIDLGVYGDGVGKCIEYDSQYLPDDLGCTGSCGIDVSGCREQYSFFVGVRSDLVSLIVRFDGYSLGDPEYDVNFDLDDNGEIDSADADLMSDVLVLEQAELDVIITKITNAVNDRIDSKPGDSDYIPELDVVNVVIIELVDADVIEQALSEGR